MCAALPLPRLQAGTSLIEVLVTAFILGVGLLGLAGLQSRLQISEMESYQRSQALTLLDDMASRITTNRAAAASYVTGTTNPLGVGVTCPTTATTREQIDVLQWCRALQGVAETSGGSNAGAMIGARGCVEQLPNNEYLITVAWQGLSNTGAPKEACGQGAYGADGQRRTVSTVVKAAYLAAP